MTTNNMINNIAVVTSGTLVRSGGIQTVTRTLFENVMSIFYLDKEGEEKIKAKVEKCEKILFSGFDSQFVDLANWAKSVGKKIAVFWHFSFASEVDPDVGEAWKSLLPLLCNHKIDLFITCKAGQQQIIEKLFGVMSCLILNNSMDTSYENEPKEGIGIYSGSGNYWVKNIRPNVYASLITDKRIDIIPYDDTIREMVKALGKEERVTGEYRLEHSMFLKRMAGCELVTYVTFAEGAPILPLEALNNGVICITGDNHGYFCEDSILHELLVCTRPDDPIAIYDCITRALKHKDEILFRYRRWKDCYDRKQKDNFRNIIKVLEMM